VKFAAEDRPNASNPRFTCTTLDVRFCAISFNYGGRSQITRGEIRRDAADTQSAFGTPSVARHAGRLSRFIASGNLERRSKVEAPLPSDIAASLKNCGRIDFLLSKPGRTIIRKDNR